MFWIIWGVLAGSYGPVNRTEAYTWSSNGIKKVLILVRDLGEARKYEEYKVFRLKFRFEEFDPTIQYSVEKLDEISGWIHHNIDNFEPTAVVCEDDPTMASMILAAYLIFRGMPLFKIIMYFHRKRKYIIMPTKEQRDLLSYYEIMKRER